MGEFEGVGSVDLGSIRQLFDGGIPFNAYMGLKITTIERGRVVAELPFRKEFIGNPVSGAMHGGVISMVADTIGGASLFTLTDPGDQLATIDLRVDYLRPGRSEPLIGEGLVVRWGNRVGVSQITLTHPSQPDTPIAVAKGVYNIKRSSG